MKTMESKRELFQLVIALHTSCDFSCRLNGRQKDGNQYANDRNDDEKFHQGETEGVAFG